MATRVSSIRSDNIYIKHFRNMAEQNIGYLWSNPPHFICYYSRAAVTVVNVRPGTVSVNTSGVQVSDTDVFRVLTQLFLPRNT